MRVAGKITVLFGLLCGSMYLFSPQASAVAIPPEGLKVGTTYYGGHFDASLNSWVVDNANQCSRIKSGDLSLENLDAVMSKNCNDDNGLGYIGSIPLHNQVSFAELSTDYKNPDYGSLGKLPAGTKLLIEYNNTCLVAEKRDVGQGGEPVFGYHRSLDLWWQTARSIGFKNGYDVMTIKKVPDSTPLSPLGSSFSCEKSREITEALPVASPQSNGRSFADALSNSSVANAKEPTSKITTVLANTENEPGIHYSDSMTLGATYTNPTIQSGDDLLLDILFIALSVTTLASIPIYALIKHPIV